MPHSQPNRTVLVTGGAGYIGSHTCKALARAGYLPVAYDDLSTGHEWAVRWGPLELGNILDEAHMREAMARHQPSAVLHFAARAYVGESVGDPARYYRTNVTGTLSLLAAMQEAKVSQIVFSSSCATFGTPDTVPIADDAPQRPINPYGASKLMVERILTDYTAAYGLRAISLRYFNAAGADLDGEIGEDHDPETHLIPLIIGAAAGTGPAVTVFGTDYPTPDGTCVRDYVHVDDLADAHVRALDALAQGSPSNAFNLGSGVGISVAEAIRAVETITGRHVRVVHGPRRAGDPALLLADGSRARGILGWTPRASTQDQMIASAWRWHQAHNAKAVSNPAHP